MAAFWYATPTFQYPINPKWFKSTTAYIFLLLNPVAVRNASHYKSKIS